jgi:integrase
MRKRGERVLGPYPDAGGWRVVVVGPDGGRGRRHFTEERAARGYADAARRAQAQASVATVAQAIEEYRKHLVAKGNKASSVTTTLHRLRGFVPDQTMGVRRLTASWCAARYVQLAGETKPDTHRNVLAEVKTWCRWLVGRHLLPSMPLEKVEGLGRRRKGKEQLRIDEANHWRELAMAYADAGELGAVAALLTGLCGLRAGEVVALTVRDLDAGGAVLWIAQSKTEAGRRQVLVPAELQPHLRAAAKGKLPLAKLLGDHWRDWPRLWVQRICAEVGVPVVTAHGMRGLCATLGYLAGRAPEEVARDLGHASPTVTQESYARREAVEAGQQQRALDLLDRVRDRVRSMSGGSGERWKEE